MQRSTGARLVRARGGCLGPAFVGITDYKDVPHLQANAINGNAAALAD